MATRVVEGKKLYTGGKAISIDENKVISLNLRDENNLIIYDEGDDEIYVDLQLDDEITPTDAFPIGVNTGRVIVDNGWDKAGTIISAVTTSGDNIKILYADEGTLWMDNGTGTFKQIYFKADVDALLLALRNYIDGELAKKQNGVSSDTAPEDPAQGDLWYDTINDVLKVYDGSQWNSTGGGSDIEYVTQAEYNALLPGALTDNKHYFIYSTSGGGGWQPGVNTIAYFPFSEDFDDKVGSRTLTVNQCTISGGYANVTGTNSYMKLSSTIGGTDITINCWYYYGGTSPYNTLFCYLNGGKHHALIPSSIEYGPEGQIGFYNELVNPGGFWGDIVMTTGNWYNIVITKSGTNEKIYVNGVSAIDSNNSFDNNSFPIGVIANSGATGGANQGSIGKFSEVIFEDKVRTAQEISNYYNQTKANYGL